MPKSEFVTLTNQRSQHCTGASTRARKGMRHCEYGPCGYLRWRLKKNVVESLLKYGADAKYMNEMGESVSTYFGRDDLQAKEVIVCDIAKMLHNAGAILTKSYGRSYSIVRIAREQKLTMLRKMLEELDPFYATCEFYDD